jgi:hypothetical protein
LCKEWEKQSDEVIGREDEGREGKKQKEKQNEGTSNFKTRTACLLTYD